MVFQFIESLFLTLQDLFNIIRMAGQSQGIAFPDELVCRGQGDGLRRALSPDEQDIDPVERLQV